MLLFLSHLFCGPCGRESVTQGVCFACQVSLNCHFHPHPPCIRNGYYLWRSVLLFIFRLIWVSLGVMSLPRYTRSSKCFSLTFVLEDLEGEPCTYQRGETINAGRNVPKVGFELEYFWNVFFSQWHSGCGQSWHWVPPTPERVGGRPLVSASLSLSSIMKVKGAC